MSCKAQPTDILLAWAKKITYDYVLTITDFSTSWVDGLVFCAILIEYRYIKVTWQEIKNMEIEDRLKLAFGIAETELNVPAILDVDDVMLNPESKSIQLYVSYLYKELGAKSTMDMQSTTQAIQAVIRMRDMMQVAKDRFINTLRHTEAGNIQLTHHNSVTGYWTNINNCYVMPIILRTVT